VYVTLYLTSYYLVGWTYMRNKWKARVKEAERRVREREEIAEELQKRREASGYV